MMKRGRAELILVWLMAMVRLTAEVAQSNAEKKEESKRAKTSSHCFSFILLCATLRDLCVSAVKAAVLTEYLCLTGSSHTGAHLIFIVTALVVLPSTVSTMLTSPRPASVLGNRRLI